MDIQKIIDYLKSEIKAIEKYGIYEEDTEIWKSTISALQKLELRQYQTTGLTPEKIREIDRLYTEKCKELAGEKEKHRWIPVTDRLPKVPEGTEDAYCPEFNVTIKGFSTSTTLKYSWDGTWFDDSGNYLYSVIAWQPLPEAYKKD